MLNALNVFVLYFVMWILSACTNPIVETETDKNESAEQESAEDDATKMPSKDGDGNRVPIIPQDESDRTKMDETSGNPEEGEQTEGDSNQEDEWQEDLEVGPCDNFFVCMFESCPCLFEEGCTEQDYQMCDLPPCLDEAPTELREQLQDFLYCLEIAECDLMAAIPIQCELEW